MRRNAHRDRVRCLSDASDGSAPATPHQPPVFTAFKRGSTQRTSVQTRPPPPPENAIPCKLRPLAPNPHDSPKKTA